MTYKGKASDGFTHAKRDLTTTGKFTTSPHLLTLPYSGIVDLLFFELEKTQKQFCTLRIGKEIISYLKGFGT